jgi:hypothetical protein
MPDNDHPPEVEVHSDFVKFPEVSPDEKGVGDLLEDQRADILTALAIRLESERFNDESGADLVRKTISNAAELCEGVVDLEQTVFRLRKLVDNKSK